MALLGHTRVFIFGKTSHLHCFLRNKYQKIPTYTFINFWENLPPIYLLGPHAYLELQSNRGTAKNFRQARPRSWRAWVLTQDLILVHKWTFLCKVSRSGWQPQILIPIPCPPSNVWCNVNQTKLISVLLLWLVRFLMHQTLHLIASFLPWQAGQK